MRLPSARARQAARPWWTAPPSALGLGRAWPRSSRPSTASRRPRRAAASARAGASFDAASSGGGPAAHRRAGRACPPPRGPPPRRCAGGRGAARARCLTRRRRAPDRPRRRRRADRCFPCRARRARPGCPSRWWSSRSSRRSPRPERHVLIARATGYPRRRRAPCSLGGDRPRVRAAAVGANHRPPGTARGGRSGATRSGRAAGSPGDHGAAAGIGGSRSARCARARTPPKCSPCSCASGFRRLAVVPRADLPRERRPRQVSAGARLPRGPPAGERAPRGAPRRRGPARQRRRRRGVPRRRPCRSNDARRVSGARYSARRQGRSGDAWAVSSGTHTGSGGPSTPNVGSWQQAYPGRQDDASRHEVKQ